VLIILVVLAHSTANPKCSREYHEVDPKTLQLSECDRCHAFSFDATGCACADSCTPTFNDFGASCRNSGHMCFRKDARNVTMFQRSNLRRYPAWMHADDDDPSPGCAALVAKLGGRTLLWIGDSVAGQFRNDFIRERCGSLVRFAPTSEYSRFGVPKVIEMAPLGPVGATPGVVWFTANDPNWWNRKPPVDLANVTLWNAWHAAFDAASWEDTVMVVNLGLHYNNGSYPGVHQPQDYRLALGHWVKAISKAVREGRVDDAILAETTLQHFSTETGDFGIGPPGPIAGYPCSPLRTPAPALRCLSWESSSAVSGADEESAFSGSLRSQLPSSSTGRALVGPGWRNRILHEERGPLAVARLGLVTEPLWDLHIGSVVKENGDVANGPDCTHWCYSPGLVEAVAFELAAAIANSNSN